MILLSLSNPIVASTKAKDLLCYESSPVASRAGTAIGRKLAGLVGAQYGAYNALIESMQFNGLLVARCRWIV